VRSNIDLSRYNYPGVTNNVMIAPESYIKLVAHPNIVGCKMSVVYDFVGSPY
jgi:2-keto-3-deoxy-L-rhamnonate aldolase